MFSPTVSVIMPVYNAEQYLAVAIESVQSQTYHDWELLIVDDGSTDTSIAIIERYLADARIKLIRHASNHGVSTARNDAIDEAQGQYLAFIDADDRWLPEKLEAQLATMHERDANLSFGDIVLIDANGAAHGTRSYHRAAYNYRSLLKYNFIANSTLIIKRQILGSLRYQDVYDNRHKKLIHEDYALLLKLFRSSDIHPYYITKPLVQYRIHAKSLSRGIIKKFISLFYIYKDSEGYSTMRSIYLAVQRAFFSLLY
jgi:glycosyltransferase involved in cell wall biosynthesis